MTWVRFTKRTDDPKLVFIERMLAEHGIPSRRSGHSFHAPILEVPEEHGDAAWKLLGTPARGLGIRTRHGWVLDDVPDDHRHFVDNYRANVEALAEFSEEGEDPIRDGWVGKDGLP